MSFSHWLPGRTLVAMKRSFKLILLRALAAFAVFVVLALVVIRVRHGGGEPYPDVSTAPRVAASELEVLVSLELPPGNVASSASGRVFFNTHPFAAPARFGAPALFELVDGEPRPYPSEAFQASLQGPFGLVVDGRERLWTVECAGLDHPQTRVLAFDLATDALVFEHAFEPGVGRFAQDLRVSADGRTLVLADTGAFRFTEPELLVFDVEEKAVVRRWSGHDALRPQDWVMRTPFGSHKVGWGLLTFAVGVDGIALSGPQEALDGGEWLYFATMTHDSLYRVPLAALLDPSFDDAAIGAALERVGQKPMSDGITLDGAGNVLVTDVEHGGVAQLSPDGALETLVADPRVVWADGVVLGAGGEVLFTDSAIPAYLRQDLQPPSAEALEAAGPYAIYRFTP